MNFSPEQIEQVATGALVAFAKNARTHSDAQIAQIAESVKAFGWTVPILIDGENTVIAGHARLRAAQLLALDTVPCIRLTHLSDTERRALVLADNRITLNSGWNEELLAFELDELRDLAYPLPLLGFTTAELNDLIGTPLTVEMPQLPDGPKGPLQQMSFMLTDEQARAVEAALARAGAMGPFAEERNNHNAHALTRVCEMFLAAHASR